MIGDNVVVDAVVHPHNLSRSNWPAGSPAKLMTSLHSFHRLLAKDPAFWLAEQEFTTDFPAYATAHGEFAESQCDLGILHPLPCLGFTSGPVTDLHKAAAIRDRWPNRFILYGSLPTHDINQAIKDLEYQVTTLHIDGLKVYPAVFYSSEVRGWMMDDPSYALPILDAARDLGIRNIAVHKAIPWGAPVDFYRVGDMEKPIGLYPEINFQMVHAGFAFLEETRMYLQSFPNFVANLEVTMAFIVTRPRLFAETLGEMLYWGKPEQFVFASGMNLGHPRPLLEAFEAFEMPADLVEGRGYQRLTKEIKRMILGENAARMHGIDLAAAREKIKDDEFEVAKSHELRPPWSGMREYAEKA